MLLASVVAILTCVAVANATQTITTPNAAFISYNLAPGANSAPITPAASKPVLVMGCCTTSGDLKLAQVSVLHIASTTILWFGFESVSPATVTQGASAVAGTHILWIDNSHTVAIQVASADTIRIHNGGAGTLAGNVTLVW